MTLDAFIISGLARQALTGAPQRLHVKEPGFSTLYVRITQRLVLGKLWKPVLDLSSIEARKPGKGSFKKLISRLRSRYPTLPLYVENVLNPRFEGGLKRLGFIDLGPGYSPCFFLPPEEHNDPRVKQRIVRPGDTGPSQDTP